MDDDNTLPSLYLMGGYPYFENTVLVTVTLNGERKITALDMNGNTQWEWKNFASSDLNQNGITMRYHVKDSLIFFISDYSNNLYILNMKNGNTIYQGNIQNTFSDFSKAENNTTFFNDKIFTQIGKSYRDADNKDHSIIKIVAWDTKKPFDGFQDILFSKDGTALSINESHDGSHYYPYFNASKEECLFFISPTRDSTKIKSYNIPQKKYEYDFIFLDTSSCFLLKSPWEWDRNIC